MRVSSTPRWPASAGAADRMRRQSSAAQDRAAPGNWKGRPILKPAKPPARRGEKALSPPAHIPQLTPREREVLSKLAQGLTDTEISRELGVTPYTANRHVANIVRKLRADSRTEAAVRAMKDGLIQ